jgi:hypothetical protein
MRIQHFPLQGESPARLQLHWDAGTAYVYLDGDRVAEILGLPGMRKGWSTVLEDGSSLEVRSIRRVVFPELSVLRNGRHLESSPSHPDVILRSSANVMFVVSALMIVTGVFGIWGRNWIAVLFGCFYLAGAFLLRARRRLGTALIAIPLFLDLDFLVLDALTTGLDRSFWITLAVNLMFATFVIRSYQAANESRQLRIEATAT